MKIFNNVDPTTNPFNEFLKNYGIWIAIVVAVLVLITVIVLFLVSQKHKGAKLPEKMMVTFDNEAVILALGGKENITSTSLNGSRIAISLKDVSKVNEVSLKENSVKSIIKMSNKITLLVEGDSKEFYNRIFKSNEL